MAFNFEDIQKASSFISTMPIYHKDKKTGRVVVKEYATVPERIKAFRYLMPQGTITTEMLMCNEGMCVFKATVMDENGHVLGTGTAYEKENSSFINATSYIENAETSSVGRALAMCGIGIDVSIASFDEVANAMKNQEEEQMLPVIKETKKVSKKSEEKTVVDNGYPEREEMLKYVVAKFPLNGDLGQRLIKGYNVKEFKELSEPQLQTLYNYGKKLEQKVKEQNEG